jgi:PAS domain S-box-containing protein
MMVGITDAAGALTFVNRHWLAFTGRSLSDELGEGWLAGVYLHDRPACLEDYRAAVQAARPFKVEFRLRRADAAYHWISGTGIPLHEDNGTFTGHIVTFVDVNDREGGTGVLDRTVEDLRLVAAKLEQERDAQIALLHALIGHMSDGVLAETDNGQVAVVNAAFRRIFGLPPDAVKDGSDSPAARLRTLLAVPDQWQPRRTSPGEAESELRLIDGRIVEQQYFPVRLDDGRVIHMWQFRDITARRQAEQEIIDSRHRVRDLSAHLEGIREEERRALARELHDELGQLLTGVRLEVASAIEKFRTTRTAAEFDVVDRLQGTVGLVDLSIATVRRITRALRPPMLDHLGLMATIRWEAAVFERRTGIRCRVSSRPATFETREHVTVLYRILLEALTNVARHANAGTIWIQVRQRPDRLIMEVRDNGRGISVDAIVNPTTLGLLGMRERALAVGGDVRFERVPAGGTNVIVTVPSEAAAMSGDRAASNA